MRSICPSPRPSPEGEGGPKGRVRGSTDMRPILWEIDLGDVCEIEVVENSGRELTAEEIDLVALAAVVEVDLRFLSRFQLDVQRHHRTERATGAEIHRRRGPDDLRDLGFAGRERGTVRLAEVAVVVTRITAERDEERELRGAEGENVRLAVGELHRDART